MAEGADATIARRFRAKFKTGAPSECWEWKGAKLGSGYGVITYQGSQTTAHRVAFLLAGGIIPSGFVIDHLCRNRGCVNPAHLEAVTHAENIRRGLKGRMVTVCAHGHQLDDKATGITAQGRRLCKICRRIREGRRGRDADYWRQYRLKRKAAQVVPNV